MEKCLKWFEKMLSGWCILLMGIMAVSVIISVFLRYVLGITFVWAEEAITYLFIATTYFGAILGVRENEHISIDFFLEAASAKVERVMRIIVCLINILVQVIVFYASLRWINTVGNVVTPGLRIPIRFFYYMLPLSTVLITFYQILMIQSYLIGRRMKSTGKDTSISGLEG